MLAIVGLHSGFEVGELIVNQLVDGHIDLCGCSPENDHASATLLVLEITNVLTQSLNHLPTGQALLHVIAIKALGIVLIEGSWHGHNLLQLVAHGVDILLLENLGIHSCLISVLGIDIPTTEHDIVELGEGHDVSIVQITGIGTTTDTHLVVLSHRTNGLGKALASHQNTCHKRG